MIIHVISVGHKAPSWASAAVDEFIKRFPPEIKLIQKSIPLIKRGKNPDIRRIVRDEGEKILSSIPSGCVSVALDVSGKKVDTQGLSHLFKRWVEDGTDIALIIGGPDGLSEPVLNSVSMRLSLSDLTFPHALAKVILVEQLYRAWSILNNHPYHRE